MTFKKLALASAIALVPTMGVAMDEIDDASMSDMTGQDGIRLTWNATTIGMDVGIHDKDGITASYQAGYTFDGGIYIQDMSIGFSAQGLVIDIDAGDDLVTGAGSTLNINVQLPTTTSIVTGSIQVGNSARDEGSWAINSLSATIMESTTIVLGATSLNIQLGNEPQGNMVSFNSTITGGINLNNFALNDTGGTITGGAIRMASMTILDNNGTDLSLNVKADVSGSGLVLSLVKVGTATGMDIRIVDQRLGSAAAGILGDISINALNINGTTLTISGK